MKSTAKKPKLKENPEHSIATKNLLASGVRYDRTALGSGVFIPKRKYYLSAIGQADN